MLHTSRNIGHTFGLSKINKIFTGVKVNWGFLATGIFLTLAIGFNLYTLFPEVTTQTLVFNDEVLHRQVLARTAAALAEGQNPTDVWLDTITLGYPLAHHYQHLAYLPTAVLHTLSAGRLALLDLFNWSKYLLLVAFPLSIFWSARRFGFGLPIAALAGLAAPLLSTPGLYGFDYNSYLWSGPGLYTQLWGMVFLPLALAQGYTTLRTGRGYVWSVLLLAATLLAHLVVGYIAFVTLAVWVVVAPPSSNAAAIAEQQKQPLAVGRWPSIKRFLLLLGLTGLASAYFLFPFWQDRFYMNRSVWEDAVKYNSYGHMWVLNTLIQGNLFDFGRMPVLTVLAGLGFIRCLWHWREPRYRLPVALALVWLLLYFGRSTWGPLLDLLPFAQDLHFHRLISGVHLGGIYLIGLGLAWSWEGALARPKPIHLVLVTILSGLMLYPIYAERTETLAQNARWMTETQSALAAEAEDIDALTTTLHDLPPGRVYAGLGNNWGKDYTVGAVPMYALLNGGYLEDGKGLDMVGYLYHALSLNADVQVLFDETQPAHFNLFNVRYVVAPVDRTWPDFVRPIQTFGRHRLYQVDTSGYFDLVDTDVAFTGHKEDLFPAASGWLNSALLPAQQHPAIRFAQTSTMPLTQLPLAQAGKILPQLELPPPAYRGQIVSEVVANSTYQANVTVARPSTLMLKATYHPGWQVTVDGRAVEPLMVMPSFVGVPLEPGIHQVRLTYHAGSWRGLLIVIGLLVLGAVALIEWRGSSLPPLFNGSQKHFQIPAGWHAQWQKARGMLQRQTGAHLKTMLALYLLFFSIYLLSGAGHFFSTDHVSVYLTTQSLIEDHDLSIKAINDTVLGPDGQSYGVFGLGQSVLSMPLYLVGVWVDALSSPQLQTFWRGPDLGDWGGTVPIFFVSLFNQIITPLTCVLVFLFGVQLGFSKRKAIFVSLMFGFGTATWVYTREYFQHPLETLLLLLTIYILFSHRHNLQLRHVLPAGLALALGMLVRINLFVVVPLVGIYVVYLVLKVYPLNPQANNTIQKTKFSVSQLWSSGLAGRLIRHLLAFSVPIILALAAIMWANQVRYGAYLDLNDASVAQMGVDAVWAKLSGTLADTWWRLDRVGWVQPVWLGIYGNLFSPGRSIFLYSPPIILGLFGVTTFYRCHRAEALLFSAIIVTYLAAYSLYGHWHGGWAWGPRMLLPTLPFFLLASGYFLNSWGRVIVAIAVMLLGVTIQLLGIFVNYSYIHWDWLNMGLSLENPQYLFQWNISPVPMHFKALFGQRYLDVWVLWIYRQFGLFVFLATISIPLMIFGWSIRRLRGE